MSDSLFVTLFKNINRVYQYSFVHRMFATIAEAYGHSSTAKILKNYFYRESSMESSSVVRFFSRLWTRLSALVRKAHRAISKAIENSLLYSIVNFYIGEGKKDLSNLTSYPVIGFIIGFSLYVTLVVVPMNTKWYLKDKVGILGIAIAGLVVIRYWKDIIKFTKESVVFKLGKYFWE